MIRPTKSDKFIYFTNLAFWILLVKMIFDNVFFIDDTLRHRARYVPSANEIARASS
jgi:hypothetical protein